MSLNRVLLCGTLGHDVDLRSTRNGRPFCRLNLATRGPLKDADGKPRTQWHSVHVFGKQAEFAVERAQKGSRVWIEGRIETMEEPATADGQRSWKTWITAERVDVLTRVLFPENDKAPESVMLPGAETEPEDDIPN